MQTLIRILFLLSLSCLVMACSRQEESKDHAEQDSIQLPLKDPIVTHVPEVIYPPGMRGKGDTAKVAVSIHLGEDGIPSEPSIVKSSDPRFDSLAKALALQYRWEKRSPTMRAWPKGMTMFFRFDPTHRHERIPGRLP